MAGNSFQNTFEPNVLVREKTILTENFTEQKRITKT